MIHALVLITSGCATLASDGTRAAGFDGSFDARGWSGGAEDVPVLGHEVSVTFADFYGPRTISGELWTVDQHALEVMTSNGLERIRIAAVEEVSVELYDAGTAPAAIWMLAGSTALAVGALAIQGESGGALAADVLFTIGAVVFIPLSLLAGIPAIAISEAANDFEIEADDADFHRRIAMLHEFARFPQGKPR